MTKEEAINRIEDHMQVHKIGEYPHLKLRVALDMAVAALRAQQEPVKLDRSRGEGCEWCKRFGSVPIRGFTVQGCTSMTAQYCPNCGRPLTEEAQAELERRIGGSYEKSNRN